MECWWFIYKTHPALAKLNNNFIEKRRDASVEEACDPCGDEMQLL